MTGFSDDEEEVFLNGRTAPEVIRRGGCVHRTHQSNSEFMAALLRELPQRGFLHGPAYLGRDERGRDVLSFLPGRTDIPRAERGPLSVHMAAGMLRQLHDATATSPLAAGEECVTHQDVGPWNFTFNAAGLPTGLFDFDMARPGKRAEDLGYLAWTWGVAARPGEDVLEDAARLRAARDGYDASMPAADFLACIDEALAHSVVVCQRRLADVTLTTEAHVFARRFLNWTERCTVRFNEEHARFASKLQ